MKTCNHCHALTDDDARYCTECGHPLPQPSAPAPQAAPSWEEPAYKPKKRGAH